MASKSRNSKAKFIAMRHIFRPLLPLFVLAAASALAVGIRPAQGADLQPAAGAAAQPAALSAGAPQAAGGERQFSLAEAIRTALANNDELKAFKSSVAAGKEDIGIARSSLQPKVTLEERALQTNNPGYGLMIKMNQKQFSAQDLAGAPGTFNYPGTLTDYQTTLSFEQPLYLKKAAVAVTMAKKEQMAKAADFRRRQQEVALNVVQAYLAVHTAAEYVKVAEMGLEDAREHLRIAQARYKSGLGLYSDTLRAATAVTDAEQRLVTARKDLNVAKRQLGLTLGLSAPAGIMDSLPEPSALAGIEHYRQAALNRPDIAALETRLDIARDNVALARADSLPMLGIGASYQLNDHQHPFGAEGESWQVAAFLRWDVFDGTKTARASDKARLEAQEAADRLAGYKKKVLFDVDNAFDAVDEAAKNVDLAKASLASAAEGKRLVETRYANSLSPIVDMLDAQVNYDNARARLVARENAYLLALANLGFASGTILSDFGITDAN